MTYQPRYPLRPSELDALAAWWQTGRIAKAAELLGVAPQTVKNQLAAARRRSRVPTTLLALRANLRAVGERHPDIYRRLRYDLDPEYRERMRNQSAERMRRHRTKSDDEQRNDGLGKRSTDSEGTIATGEGCAPTKRNLQSEKYRDQQNGTTPAQGEHDSTQRNTTKASSAPSTFAESVAQ